MVSRRQKIHRHALCVFVSHRPVFLFHNLIPILIISAVNQSTDPESRRGFGPYLEGVGRTFVDEEGDTQVIRYGVLKDLESALDLYRENVAAFLVEPIQGVY